ncbi:uncharacterized protein LOC108830060 [Raphanus sativus]|uniref:Uncharacterized protein LOC108830060 n=1 Tax=Raphanus sativus TaxID=3726 RepID=A0A9W3CMC9_RAPSA|nr:uncharacterized protein LOC108830060 [Raphanus sativus]
MDLVIIVSGNWVKKNKYVFNTDIRGCRVLHLDEDSTYEVFAKSVLDDYGLEMSDHIQLSYMFSNKSLKTMAHDTPPVYVSNTRQLKGFVTLKKIEQLRLCVEITENKDDIAREKTKTNFSFSSEVEASEKEEEDNEIDCSIIVEGENQNVGGEDETGKENEEDDEFDSRFDMFDDSDGASSEDDNFSSYGVGESPSEDQESPTLPPKKIYQNFSMSGSKESEEVLLRLKMSSLNLAVGQQYESKADLERRLKLLTVKDQFDYDVDISTRTLFIVKCWIDGCIWRVRASTKGESPAFYVCIYESKHTCSTTERSNRCRHATPDILGELYKNFLGDVGPAVHPTSVGIVITKKFGVKMEYWKSYRTLKFAREIDQGTPESGFERLPSYLYMLITENPSTVARLQIDENGKFMYVFLAFGASVNGFPFMRKVVVVDGTFLNGRYKGTLLKALAQDGNFQIFPIAFVVVDTENDDSWHWFFTQLKLLIPDDEGLAIISDKHNSIGKAITNVYPLASRGICTYHLYKNILGRYKGKDAFRLVKKAVRCFRMSEFTQIFEEIEAINPALHDYLQRADVRLWTRVHFPGERYNLMTTNIAESMNRALSNARGLNIVRILESIRVMMTRWFAERREDARSQRTTLTRGVEKLLHDRVTAARDLTVQRIDDHHTEVKHGSSGESLHVVNLVERKCTCRRFELEKLPCVHAIAAAEYMNVSRISLCSPYYTSNYLVSAYTESVMPVDSAQTVPEIVANQPCLSPTVRQPPGRPKKNRMKSALEVALANKRS